MANKEEKQTHEYTKRQLSHAKQQARRQKIYLFSGIGVIVVVAALIFCGWLFGEFIPLHKVVVEIGETKITQQDIIDASLAYATGQSNFDISSNLDYILQALVQNVLVEQEAAKLGITVTEEEVNTATESMGLTDAMKKLYRASMITEKLKTDYFEKQVSVSGNQVLMNAMMVESEELVPEIRTRLLNGESFTTLADELAQNKVSKDNHGVFEWHPASILSSDIGTSVPVEWAFTDEAKKGVISNAIPDTGSSKQLGYWLLKLNEPTKVDPNDETTANVSALLVSSQALAVRIKSELVAGADLAELTEKYSQYSTSQQGHGTIVINQSDNISQPFNDYVFNAGTVLGQWSDPIKDTRYWTKGGAWIVQIVDQDANRPYSDADKSTMVDKAYTDWTSGLWSSETADIKYTFDDPERQFVIGKVSEKLK